MPKFGSGGNNPSTKRAIELTDMSAKETDKNNRGDKKRRKKRLKDYKKKQKTKNTSQPTPDDRIQTLEEQLKSYEHVKMKRIGKESMEAHVTISGLGVVIK